MTSPDAPHATSFYRSVLLGDVNDFPDEEGRPIGEVRASLPVRTAVPTEYRRAPYPVSRAASGLPMNQSALRQVARNWPTILGVAAYVRTAYLERWPRPELTLFDFARIAAIGLQLPAYVMFREPDGALDTGVPSFVAGAHKMLAGVFGLSKNLLLQEVAAGNRYDTVPAAPESLAAAADESGMLVGRSGSEVCAGTPAMIADALHVLAHGTSTRALADRGPVGALVRDTGSFCDYASSVLDMTLWLLMFSLRARELVGSLGAAIDAAERDRGGPTPGAIFAATYDVAGISDPMLKALTSLDTASAHVMIRGAAELVMTVPRDTPVGCLLGGAGATSSSDAARVGDWLADCPRFQNLDRRDVAAVGAVTARCLRAEQQALGVFALLEASLLGALGRPLPDVHGAARRASGLFGALPSEWFAEILGVGVHVTPAAALTDGHRTLRLDS